MTEHKVDGKPFKSDQDILDLYDHGDEAMKKLVFEWTTCYNNTSKEREDVRLKIIQKHNREKISWKNINDISVPWEIKTYEETWKTARSYAFNMPSYNKKT